MEKCPNSSHFGNNGSCLECLATAIESGCFKMSDPVRESDGSYEGA